MEAFISEVILVIAIGAAIAGFAQGLSGFAFGMLSMSIWVWVVEPHQASVLVVFGALTGQFMSAFTVKRAFKVSLLWPYIAGGLLGIPIGVGVLPILSIDWFKVFIGVFLLTFCATTVFAKSLPRIKTRNKGVSALVGLVGGVMAGIGGMSGVAPTLWCTMSNYSKDEQRSIIQNFSLSILLVTMVTYICTGMVTRQMLPLFAVILPSMLIPTWLGMRLYKKISLTTFRRVILVLLTLAALSMLISSIPKIIASH